VKTRFQSLLFQIHSTCASTVRAANTPTDFAKLFEAQLKSPVAAVAARGEQVIAAEVSGVVSFISLTTQRVYCELQAHSRFLSAMDVHPSRDVFATVGLDKCVCAAQVCVCGTSVCVLDKLNSVYP
jgi:hypothetical protein